jgi:hypothetical protein
MQSEHINEIAGALAKAQGKMESALKDANNPFFKSKYASLDSVWEAIRGPLSSNGLSVIQTIEGSGDSINITTTLAHSSGQWISSSFPIVVGRPKPQELGSVITYMRRYALSSLVGVTADEDDDGNAAQEQAKKQPTHEENARKHHSIAKDKISKGECNSLEVAILEFDDAIEYRKRLLDSCKKEYGDIQHFADLPKEAFAHIMASISRRKEKQAAIGE